MTTPVPHRRMPTDPHTEEIVFVTEDGAPTGETAPKLASHHAHTRLHLAFSCYVLRVSDEALLLTRRADEKKVFPGVWSNSVCGHPAPGEPLEDAVRRRAAYELGLQELSGLRCVLPVYRYRTPPYRGIVENEFCPVFVAWTDGEPNPNPTEVDSWRWIAWDSYRFLLRNDPDAVSFWARDQLGPLERTRPWSAQDPRVPRSTP